MLTSEFSGNVIDLCPVGKLTFKNYVIETDSPAGLVETVLGLTRNCSYYDDDDAAYMVIVPSKSLGTQYIYTGNIDECLSLGIFKSILYRVEHSFELDIAISISFRLTLEDYSIIEAKFYSGHIPISIFTFESKESIQKFGDKIYYVFNLVELYAEMFDYQTEVVDFEAGNIPKAKVKHVEILGTTTYLGITRNCTIKINKNPFGVVIPEKPFF